MRNQFQPDNAIPVRGEGGYAEQGSDRLPSKGYLLGNGTRERSKEELYNVRPLNRAEDYVQSATLSSPRLPPQELEPNSNIRVSLEVQVTLRP